MMISFSDVTVKYGSTLALNNVDVKILTTPGVTGLIGPNGAGKTTFIETALGLRKIHTGSISYDDSRIFYCQDSPEFEPRLTAREIVISSLLQSGIDYTEKTVEEVLQQVGLGNVKNKYGYSFSRGMKQRLGLATCIVLSPDVLFLDEPTSALDPFGRQEVLRLITEISSKMRVIISTHLLEDVGKVADDVIVLNQGKLSYAGSKAQFIDNQKDDWEIIFKDKKSLNIVQESLIAQGEKIQNSSKSRLGIVMSGDSIPNLLRYLSGGEYLSIESIGPTQKEMYGAFEDIVKEGKNVNFN